MSHKNDTALKPELPKSAPTPIPRRRLRKLAGLLALLLLVVWAAPWVIAHSPLRNLLIGRLASDGDWRVTAGGASFGWITPLRLSEVTAEHTRLPLQARIAALHGDRTWWAAWLGLPAIGRIELQAPEIEFVIPPEMPQLPPRRASHVTGEFAVQRATLRLFQAGDTQPLLDLREMNLVARIQPEQQGRVLTIEPVRLLDDAELTPELCNAGLQLVAPVLANSTAVSGRASLELQKLQVPLDAPNVNDMLAQTNLEGTLKLEHVTTSLKDTVFRDLATVAAQLLRVKLPTTVRVSEGTEVLFALRDGRVYHDGLTFLLPELSSDMEWRTRGSVGFDETLDLVVYAHLPFSLAGDNPLLRRLTDNPLEFRIVGTIDDPQLQLPPGRPWLEQAVQATIAETLSTDAQPLAAAAIGLLERLRADAAESQPDGSPTVWERLRDRIEERREQRGEGQGGLFGKKRRTANEGEPTPEKDSAPSGALSL